MNHLKYILAISALFLFFLGQSNDLKKLFKFLKKGDLEKMEEVLNEGLQEDGDNPAYLWIASRLYSTDSLEYFDIDSAYLLINKALVSYDSADQAFIEDFDEYGYAREDLVETSDQIRELHWQRVKKILSIDAIKDFRDRYPASPQNVKAIYLRDSLAYVQVSQIDNWLAYSTYIRLYPRSTFFKQAKARYDRLLFEDKTKSGSYEDYVRFVEKYPSSPFREKAIKKVLDDLLAWNDPDTLVNFVGRYTGSAHVSRALDYLYHLDGRKIRDSSLYKNHVRFDSLQMIHKLNQYDVFPYPYEKGVALLSPYGAFHSSLDYYSLLGKDVFCGLYPFDFFVGINQGSGKAFFMNRNGGVFFEEEILTYSEIGLGVIWIMTKSGAKLIHKVGKVIADDIAEASLIDDKWIKVRKGDKWSLMAINGSLHSSFLYDDVITVGNFWIFEQEGLYAFTNTEQLGAEVGKGGFTLIFKYDDYELVNDDLMIGFKDDMEGLIDSQLKFIIPWSRQTIFSNPAIPYAKRSDQYYLYGNRYNAFKGKGFADILINENWIALKEDDWQVASTTSLDFDSHIDSVRMVGDKVIFIQRGDSAKLKFPSREVGIMENDHVLVLSSPAEDQGIDKGEKYLQLSNEEGSTILSINADTLFSGDHQELKALGDSLFSVEDKGKIGVLTCDGNWLLEPEYDFVQRNQASLSILSERKIGTYFLFDSLLFDPIYSSNVEALGMYFKASEGRNVGLIDSAGETVVPFKFQAAEFFNDSLYWLKTDTSWVVARGHDQQLFIYGIQSYSRIDYQNDYSYKVLTSNGYGVISSSGKQIIASTFSDIKVIGDENQILYVCEQSVPEADFYIWVGYDYQGHRIFSEAYRGDRYDEIACD